MAKRHLKVSGDLGRIVFMVCLRAVIYEVWLKILQEWDVRNTPSIEEAVRHSDVVYNLVGRRYPTKSVSLQTYPRTTLNMFRNFDLEDVHVESAERIAEAVAKYDIDRFIHLSSYNADKKSPSEFYRTKACQYLTNLLCFASLI